MATGGVSSEMGREMTVWGVGPKFTVFSVLCLALALVVHCVWYPLFVVQGMPYAVLVVIGLILISIGLPMWIAASKEVDRAFEAGELATQGVYALCRHPIYGSAIFFVVPGILLFFRSTEARYSLLSDGDVITVGTIRVQAIATPGHTPGVMSFLVNDHVLFTGDTLALRNGQAYTFCRLFNKDTAMQRESIRKLASLSGINLLCTAHTGCTSEYVRAMQCWRGMR